MLFVVGLLLFIGLVIVHEMGHFWAARRNGVEVEEFGIFFPPRLWKKRMKKGWDFTINALPLGGFVKLKGETDSDRRPGSFGAASDWAKTKIMLAGVAVNLAVAVLIFTVLALVGMPKIIDNQFTVARDTRISHSEVRAGYIEAKSPAANAGLKDQDTILAIGLPVGAVPGCKTAPCNAQQVKAAQDVRAITHNLLAQSDEVAVLVQRGDARKVIMVTPNSLKAVAASEKTNKPIGYLGIVPSEYILQRSTWSAPVVAVGLTGQLTVMTFQGLGKAIAGLGGMIAGTITGNTNARQHAQTEASSQVSGPLGIIMILKTGSSLGIQYMLLIIAVISLTLAIMNVLPIPALDGGRVYLMWFSRLTKKPLTPKMEENIYATSFILLITLIVVVTIVDVRRFF